MSGGRTCQRYLTEGAFGRWEETGKTFPGIWEEMGKMFPRERGTKSAERSHIRTRMPYRRYLR